MPTSPRDREAMQRGAFPCTLFELRHRGDRLPAATVLAIEPLSGYLICRQQGTPFWIAHLYRNADIEQPVYRDGDDVRLLGAQLQRENAGVRLYQGWHWNTTATERLAQTWLCTPTTERGLEILSLMAIKEAAAMPESRGA